MPNHDMDGNAVPESHHSNDGSCIWQSYFPTRGSSPSACSLDNVCPSAPLQWWYGNAHLRLKGESEDSFSFFSSFFHQCDDACPSDSSAFHDACTWALCDLRDQKYYADSLLDFRSIGVIRNRIDPEVTGRPVVHAEASVLELVKQGRLPRPDRTMKKQASYHNNPLRINFDDECILEANGHNNHRTYSFFHKKPSRGIEVDLVFEADCAPVIHGEEGVVNDMYYYFIPYMTVSGIVTINGSRREVEGVGWYDREFGGAKTLAGRDALDAWAWFSLHLSNGAKFSLFRVIDCATKEIKDTVAIYVTEYGRRLFTSEVSLSFGESWTSLVTFMEYPTRCHIEAPSFNFKCTVAPSFCAQEFATLLVGGGGFFEGRVEGSGVVAGHEVLAYGFLEYKNYGSYTDTETLMNSVGRYVRQTLGSMYPLQASDEWVNENVLGRHALGRGLSSQKLCDTLFRPVRSLIDRGGKAWRSLILVSSCNALSPEYFDCTRYIAMAELLHVGSLIIDDIQDNSVVRRGGECVHLEYGVPTAINAGTACYFMAPFLARVQDLPAEKANRIYNIYFDVLRAGHAGQGLDVYGLDYLMPEVVHTGDARPLFDALEAIHTYKTGGAASSLCLVACILCDASQEVSNAMENFGLKLGLAFQIVDDALNLKGFDGELKELGEDVSEGKITYPIAKAMHKLCFADREKLWRILMSKPQDVADVREVIDLVNMVHGVEDSLEEARRHIDESWALLEPLLEDSLPKIMMRNFCHFLTERTW